MRMVLPSLNLQTWPWLLTSAQIHVLCFACLTRLWISIPELPFRALSLILPEKERTEMRSADSLRNSTDNFREEVDS